MVDVSAGEIREKLPLCSALRCGCTWLWRQAKVGDEDGQVGEGNAYRSLTE
ncbi:MAG: hypothetical protein QM691_16725 [Opitutaceae bacterium]